MADLILRTGNIFGTHSRGIGHGCNTSGQMGAGIAKQFRERFPDEMYDEYRHQCQTGLLVGGGLHAWRAQHLEAGGGSIFVYNIASQELPGPNASYPFLYEGVRKALAHAYSVGITQVALPRIGSGIGGLDESYVEGILFALAQEQPVNIELWTYKDTK